MSECKQCGGCCKHIGSPPILPDEIDGLPFGPKAVVQWFLHRDDFRSERDIPYYFWAGEDGCMIHHIKPSVCAEFEPGCEACQRFRVEAMA